MTLNEIWKFALCILSSVGGIGAIIVFAVKFSADIIANKLEEKYAFKLNKELEKYKASIDNKKYISKTKFDTEFQIYRELSKKFFEAVKSITIMIPAGYATYPADKDAKKEYENGLYEKALKATVEAQDELNANIPFILDSIYSKYEEILSLCRVQLGVFEDRWNVLILSTQEEKERFDMEDYKRSRDLRDKFKLLNENIRDYLSSIDVVE